MKVDEKRFALSSALLSPLYPQWSKKRMKERKNLRILNSQVDIFLELKKVLLSFFACYPPKEKEINEVIHFI
jgi:hypothetical protein